MTLKAITWLTLVTLFPALHCSMSPTAGNGGSSETVNAKVAIIDTLVRVIIEDRVDEALSLRVFASNYRPYEKTGYNDSTVGSASGVIQWNAPAAGIYNLLLTLQSSGRSCFVSGISPEPGASDTVLCVLDPVRTLTGALALSDSSNIDGKYTLSIYGSPFCSLTDSSGQFTIEAVPAGKYTLSVRSTAKRLFITTSNYVIATEALDSSTRLRVVLP